VRDIFERVDGWPKPVNGLSSGEGLKYAVRDPLEKMETNKRTGTSELVLVDPGVTDKRLLVVEPEFTQVLRQGARSGNTLSPVVRSAWDSGNLRTLTKNDPVVATDAHITIIGHITREELQRELTATEIANGFANRFLPQAVRRSKRLPFGGGELPEEIANGFAKRIAKAAESACVKRQVGMTSEAKAKWAAVYDELSEGRLGMLGAITARAEAQCIRLALHYALLDGCTQIDASHLDAALAIWERAEATALWLFGSSLGDPVADEILRTLRAKAPAGMTRTEISAVFKRHESGERIGAALDLLSRRRLAVRVDQSTQGGRPAEMWRAA
jgi:hypothetical protein